MNGIKRRFRDNVASIVSGQIKPDPSGIAQLGYTIRGKYMVVDDTDSRYMFARFIDGGFVRARHEGLIVPKPDKYVRVVTTNSITYLKPLTKEEEFYYEGGNSTTAQVGIHSHKRGTPYEFEIDPYLLGNGRTTVYEDLKVKTTQAWFWDNGAFDGMTEVITDLSVSLPGAASTWYYVTLSIDPATNAIEIEEGTEKSIAIPLLMSDIPVPDAENICLCAIKLRYGQTEIYPADIIDLRGSLISQAIATLQIGEMTGATSGYDGESGLVPQPVAGEQDKALLGDGTFAFRHLTSTASETLTIASGVVTGTSTASYFKIAAESGTAGDLDTLTLTGAPRLIVLQADTGDTITVKHSTDNIELNGAVDFELSGDKTLALFWDGTNLADVGAGGGGAGGSFATLSDVDVSTPPTDGQVPVWDDGDSKWKPGTVSGGDESTAEKVYAYTVFR